MKLRRAITLVAVLALLMVPLAYGEFGRTGWTGNWIYFAEWRYVQILAWGGKYPGFQFHTRPYWGPR